jgi:Nucleotidyl transferase AbiEii toxin, Type IV TA system
MPVASSGLVPMTTDMSSGRGTEVVAVSSKCRPDVVSMSPQCRPDVVTTRRRRPGDISTNTLAYRLFFKQPAQSRAAGALLCHHLWSSGLCKRLLIRTNKEHSICRRRGQGGLRIGAWLCPYRPNVLKWQTMPVSFAPNLDILPPPQRRLWAELVAVPLGFVLYGGTGVALHLGHRTSIDFHFFGGSSFDPDRLYFDIPFLAGTEVLQKAKDTLSCLVDQGGPVQVSFFGLPGLHQLAPPCVAPGNGVKVAALIDLAGMKAWVVQKRAEARDYLDLDAMIEAGAVDLPKALAAACYIFGSAFNPLITLKALSYFEDGNLGTLPAAVRARMLRAVRAVDPGALP